MKIEWLFEAKQDFRALLLYYKNNVGVQAAERFANKILDAVNQLERFPELGRSKLGGLMEQCQFRALFIDQYACIYQIDGDAVNIYYLLDARTNYIYNIFGVEQ